MPNVEGVNLGEPTCQKWTTRLEGGESGLQNGRPAKGGSVTFDSLLKLKAILSCETGTEQSLDPTVQISKICFWLARKDGAQWPKPKPGPKLLRKADSPTRDIL